jgi:ATP-dependent helicase/nuclease subunit A
VIVPGLEKKSRTDKQEMLRWLEQTKLVGENEHEEHEFVVAPIGGNGQQGEIYRWVGRQMLRKENDEAKRLLYVAATRARSELHLMGTAELKKGGQEFARPWSGSLLRVAWGALEPEFQRAFGERVPVAVVEAEQQGQLPFPFPPMIALRRLPADWGPPVAEEALVTEAEPVMAERRHGSLATRAFGTTVHALLEDLARDGSTDNSGWRPRAAALLRSAGIPRSEAESQAAEVVKTLQAVLNDPDGRWILGARTDAQSETSWSSWVESDGGERVQTLRGDRIFRAGATPGSLEDSHLWIVDYKTARHGASGLTEFLEEEKKVYLPQLEGYAAIVRKVRGETGPICLALYYPLLQKLLWWSSV